jgi:hypothetical protein
MALSLSWKAASPENPLSPCYEVNLDVYACFKVLGGFLSHSSEEWSYETA